MPEKIELFELLAEIEAHRKRAEHARRLAAAIDDAAAQEILRDYAEELDRLAKELEVRLALTKQPSRPAESDENTAAPDPPPKPDKRK
jgi:hypothetical protein